MKKIFIADAAVAAGIMAKAHVGAYTRKDGTFVAEHEDGRAAAMPPVHSDHAFDRIHAAGGQNVKTSSSGISYYHGGELKHLPHKEDSRGDRYVDGADLHSHLSAMKKPADQLPSKEASPAMGLHKVGDRVSYKGARGSTRTGKVKGHRDGKVIVEHKAGYTEAVHHSELSKVSDK